MIAFIRGHRNCELWSTQAQQSLRRSSTSIPHMIVFASLFSLLLHHATSSTPLSTPHSEEDYIGTRTRDAMHAGDEYLTACRHFTTYLRGDDDRLVRPGVPAEGGWGKRREERRVFEFVFGTVDVEAVRAEVARQTDVSVRADGSERLELTTAETTTPVGEDNFYISGSDTSVEQEGDVVSPSSPEQNRAVFSLAERRQLAKPSTWGSATMSAVSRLGRITSELEPEPFVLWRDSEDLSSTCSRVAA